ncbi:hypothetical protein Taro_051408 [Colocasia esculenta]|uniref:Kinesin-like protein n=1 Tax=Colocasia esculenta TaxID=4460 RepID=A0A843XH29_COLES|nr:hypothetical protein [Colocasia esculenta]
MGAVGEEELTRWERDQDEVSGITGGWEDSIGCESVSSGRGGVGGVGSKERIEVSVRLRPLSAMEVARNEPSDWECINDTTIIFRNSMPERSMVPTAYTFDRVFRCDSTTKHVYEEGAREVALSVVSGINGSIFAYGQTSSGKTYTMTGITEYAMNDIYDYIRKHKERAFVLKFAAMEIYNEAVRDLLRTESIPLRVLDDPDRGTIIEKLTEVTLRDWNHMQELLSICEAQRQIGETSLNEMSSRSHQILRLTIESSAREFLGKDNSSTLSASVNFVDLAGSERASQALSAGARLKEGCHINRSLLTLGTVIRKLSKGRNGHIPYRDSKLTRILQPALGGNARTAIICTICPARSHIEQSRNTLLFASCAKEVVTSAQVNIVMSDKALVKHLQRELARLECELRCPGQISSKSYVEALLKEKDAQIQKMEKEIKELIQQRDLAQSRIEDLLRALGDDRGPGQWHGYDQLRTLRIPDGCEEELSTCDSSGVVDFSFIKCSALKDFANLNENSNEILENSNEYSTTSPQSSISTRNSIGLASKLGRQVIPEENCPDTEDICKEVCCIEINDATHQTVNSSNVLTERNDNLESPFLCDNNHGNQESVAGPVGEMDQSGRRAVVHFGRECPEISSPWSSTQINSRGLGLTRSRSCRATLMDSSAFHWFQEGQQNVNTPPSSFRIEYTGRPEVFHKGIFPLNYGSEIKAPVEYKTSERTSVNVLKAEYPKTETEEDITSSCTVTTELEMAQAQFHNHLNDDQIAEQNANEDISIEKPIKDACLDTAINTTGPLSIWPEQFEKQQKEIIELWHACNVSLAHRTYFFLLFKGDPRDSVYMEVELRRLSFLKRVFMQGNLHTTAAEHGCSITLSSSIRALRRERGTLSRQMQKRFSTEERESLYHKWGISLQSKRRKVQLARLLWSDTRSMDHIRESALLVAKLVGLLELDQALKEMFGLSFTPQQLGRRSQSWRHGISSLM